MKQHVNWLAAPMLLCVILFMTCGHASAAWDQPPRSLQDAHSSAGTLRFSMPGAIADQETFAALSPELETYLTSLGDNVGALLYDVSHQRTYSYNTQKPFVAASSMKVPIMLTFLDQTEQQEREPDMPERHLLTTMIENSDNNAASELYYNKIGGAAGITSFMQKIGVGGLYPNSAAWGYSLITPETMVALLAQLSSGSILNPQDRAFAINLMEHVETDQRIGVGDTAPAGATVAMKDGWVVGPDGLWVMNSSGIVTLGQETYIIAVYSQRHHSLANGHAIVRHICQMVASSLI